MGLSIFAVLRLIVSANLVGCSTESLRPYEYVQSGPER